MPNYGVCVEICQEIHPLPLAFGIMPAPSKRPLMFHLRMLAPEQFAALRTCLLQSGFSESALRKRLEIPPEKPLDIVSLSTRPWSNRPVADCLDALINLFVLGDALPTDAATSRFSAPVWDALRQSELVVVEAGESTRCAASAALFPLRDLYFAADRWANVDHSIRTTFNDIVYPAMTKSGSQFLNYTSYAPCEDFLELCAGTAPAALLAARTAKNVWAADITERSLAYAKFNAALNGIQNVSFALGDLFQPLEGRMFDRIAVHPPYLPVLKTAEIYSSGGQLGEDVLKKIVSELPGRLKPGGRLYCRTLGMDRAERSFEDNVRQWLGKNQSDFDIALFVLDALPPRRFALEQALTSGRGRAEIAEWEEVFEQNRVTTLLAVVLVIQRKDSERAPFVLRRTMRDGTAPEAIEWAFRWETDLLSKRLGNELQNARPIATAGTEITARHVLKDGELAAEEFKMRVKQPFDVEWTVQPWMPLLLPMCDGKKTVADLFEACKQNGWILPETPAAEFCGLIGTLVSGGFLQVEKLTWREAAG